MCAGVISLLLVAGVNATEGAIKHLLVLTI